ncbi:hypothetical protein F8M41_002325 [Gigaspora margarita]|uniref:BED-type domain-containing protein n=1 Tax=Gigaspora margarita TaxID=4874 RepID=A0A8H4B4P1_GIGMA|nr:hypothetical protein F8M41_002325 [Gigaspora margarita]
MGKANKTHPIFKKFIANTEKRKTICSVCNKEYASPLNPSTAKNHFRINHSEIWDEIKCKPLHSIKGKNKERYDIIDQENCNGVIAESSQTGFMYNDEIPDHDTVIISSDSSNCDDDDVEMVNKMKKFNLLESITMESENTEVKIEGDKIKITGKAKIFMSYNNYMIEIPLRVLNQYHVCNFGVLF